MEKGGSAETAPEEPGGTYNAIAAIVGIVDDDGELPGFVVDAFFQPAQLERIAVFTVIGTFRTVKSQRILMDPSGLKNLRTLWCSSPRCCGHAYEKKRLSFNDDGNITSETLKDELFHAWKDAYYLFNNSNCY